MDGRRMRVFFYCRFFLGGGGRVVILRKSAVTAFMNDNRERLSHHCHAVDCRSTEMCQLHLLSSISFSLSALTVSPGERALLLMSLYTYRE
jgi:hypothetical protein